MARVYDVIDERLGGWLEAQPLFIVSTAPRADDGVLNCSPKGNRREFAVVDPHTVAFVDQTGSGVETIAHLRENGRIVMVFFALDGKPRIVRLHGAGRSVLRDDPEFGTWAENFAPGVADGVGVRSIIVVDVARIADSCGYGVPLLEMVGHRPTMDEWSARKGPDGIRRYWADKNLHSIDDLDGLPPEVVTTD